MKIWPMAMAAVASLWLLTAAPINLQSARGATENDVFSWREIPQDQEIPIVRALFDRGGYQLYDTEGETIVVPFSGNSLSVMKFYRSDTDGMYLVNTGDTPVLYVPEGGRLENADVPDAYWYPFARGFNPSQPVYMSFAPSYDDYDNMGWYPGMNSYGGYWSDNYIHEGAAFGFAFGLIFLIGGHDYEGWHEYRSYYLNHGTGYRMEDHHPEIYRWAVEPIGARQFQGSGRSSQVPFRHTWNGETNQHPLTGGTGGQHSFTGGNGNQHSHTGGGGNQIQPPAGTGGQHSFTGGNGNQHSYTGGGGNQIQPPAGTGGQHSFTGSNGNRRSYTGGGGNQIQPPAGTGGQHSFTGGNGNQHQFTGGSGNQIQPRGGNGGQPSFTGGIGNQNRTSGGSGDRNGSTGGKGDPRKSTGGSGLQPGNDKRRS